MLKFEFTLKYICKKYAHESIRISKNFEIGINLNINFISKHN